MAGAYNVTVFRHSVIPSFNHSVFLSFRHHQFPFIILVTVAHIQLKFGIWICHEKMTSRTGQVWIWSWFDYFGRVMPLLLWKWYEIFIFRSLSPQRYCTFNSNLTNGYVIWIKSSNLVMVRWFLAQLCPFYLENNMKFSVPVHYLPQRYFTFNSNLTNGYVMRKYRSSFNLVMILWFFAEICHFTLKIIWNFQFLFIISPTVLNIQLKLYVWRR
jgi:hypothetical protein